MNYSSVDNSVSIIDPFINSTESYKSRNALWVNKKYFTYDELYKLSIPLANWIQQFCSKRVLIFSPRSLVAYQAIIASLLAGKAYVPLNPNMPANRNRMMADLSDSDLIVVDGEVTEKLIEFLNLDHDKKYHLLLLNSNAPSSLFSNYKNLTLSTESDLKNSCDFSPMPHKDTHDDACLLFTSGSTGVPKGVMLSHSNILSYLRHTVRRYHLTAVDRVTQMTELTFDFSVQDMFMSWSVGACVYAFPENYFIGLSKYLNENKITFMTTVPSTARLLYNLGKLTKNSLPYLRQNIFGGEPFSDSIAHLWQKAAPNTIIDNVCGPTEATIAYLSYQWSRSVAEKKGPRDCIPLGIPFPGQKIKIIDENMRSVPHGIVGELCLHGSQVINGYWQNPELSQQKFIELEDENGALVSWYRTGDMVLWDKEDGVVFKGRVDDQIQIRGCRVEKLEIERVVREQAETEFAAIIPWPIASDGTVQGVIAFVTGTSLDAENIYKRCRKVLPDYMTPKEVLLIDKLPLNFNGKVDYLALKKMKLKSEESVLVN